MKILHTSDWHLGKKIEGRERLKEQEQVIQEICSISDKENVDMILICGDIYDTFNPSAEVEDMFYNTVSELSQGGRKLVAVIAGNHDDPVRLCAASVLAKKQSIIISGGGEESFTSFKSKTFSLIDGDKGFMELQSQKGERAVLNMLAYPSEARLKEYATETPYSQKIENYLSFGNQRFNKDKINLTLTHLFTAGAHSVGDERQIEVGGLKICSTQAFSSLNNYVALGHIHGYQKLNDNMFYSGSILKYAVDDNRQKGVNISCLKPGKISDSHFIPLSSGKKVINLECESFEEAIFRLNSIDDYVYLTLKQNKPIENSEFKLLKSSYPNVVYIDFKLLSNFIEQEIVSKKNMSKSQLFIEYYKSKHGGDAPNDKLLALYLSFME